LQLPALLMLSPLQKNQSILVDAHVHIHRCFDIPHFFNAALNNFQSFSATPSIFVLLLTETAAANYFDRLQAEAEQASGLLGDWSIANTQESCALSAYRHASPPLFLIAGKQIVTAEGLEVLALMTTQSFADGHPLPQVLEAVSASGAIPVIPWGFGKWMGRRKRVLQQLFVQPNSPRVFLGDNSGRPNFWPTPPFFDHTSPQASPAKVLPGSDPLPFPAEVKRPGRFGGLVKGAFDPHYPAASLKELLQDPTIPVTPYGTLEKPYIFLRHQVNMQLLKHFQHN
jgi:hypothetical protein